MPKLSKNRLAHTYVSSDLPQLMSSSQSDFIIVHLVMSMTSVIINYLIKRPVFLDLSGSSKPNNTRQIKQGDRERFSEQGPFTTLKSYFLPCNYQ